MSGIALALPKFDNSGVAAMAFFLRRGYLVEKNFHGIFLMQPGSGESPIVDAPSLAQGDHFLSHRAGGFRLSQRGGDAFVFDEAANQVGKHRIAVLTGAAQFGGSLEMAHKALQN
jgi:hypothetical protein